MLYEVIKTFKRKGELQPVGSIIELPEALAAKLAGFIQASTDGRDLPHYCTSGGAWCSSKLPQHMDPTPCQRCGDQKESR